MNVPCLEFNQPDFAYIQKFDLYNKIFFENTIDQVDSSDQESEGDYGSDNDSETVEYICISSGSSGEDSTSNNYSDSDSYVFDRQQDKSTQEKETSSQRKSGLKDENSEFTEYSITITGNQQSINRTLEGSENERTDISSDDEFVEYDFISDNENLYRDGSSEQSGTQIESYSSQVDSDDVDFNNTTLEFLGIISGCLLFIVVTVILKYIFKFFNLFF